jgi:hypothetical protein
MLERVREGIRAEMWKFGVQLGKAELHNVARAAIEAMREPNEEVVAAAIFAFGHDLPVRIEVQAGYEHSDDPDLAAAAMRQALVAAADAALRVAGGERK